jgi:hypothetical protein
MPAIPPRYRGASDQASPDAGRDAVAGVGASEMRRRFPSRRPKPHGSWRESLASLGSPMAHPPKARRAPTADSQTPNGGESMGDEPNRRTDHHRGPCGASLQTPRAGRLGTWRTCGLTDFSMPRCCEASRSVGPKGSKSVPRALGPLEASEKALDGRGPCPGPTKEYGR